jgi:hypothetical protein
MFEEGDFDFEGARVQSSKKKKSGGFQSMGMQKKSILIDSIIIIR